MVGVSQIPQAARLPRRSLQQSSATEASSAPSNGTHTDSHASHDAREAHGASKYVEAMRNPDWRRKDGQSRESDTRRSESLGFDHVAHKSSSSRNTGTEGSHEANDSDTSGSWDLIDMGPPRTATREHREEQPHWHKAAKGRQQGFANKYLHVPPGFCQLVSPQELPTGWPMSLLEVRALSKQQAVAQSRDAKLLHVRRAEEKPFMG